MANTLTRSISHLGTGLRLLLFLPVKPQALRARLGEFVLIAALCIAAKALFEFAEAGENAWFNPAGFTSVIAVWAVLALIVAALEWLTGSFRVIDVLVAIGAVGVWIFALSALVEFAPAYARSLGTLSPGTTEWVVFGASMTMFVWNYVAIWRVGRVAAPAGRRRFAFGLVAAVLLGTSLLPSTPLFSNPNNDAGFSLVGYAAEWLRSRRETRTADAPPRKPIDVERTFYRQPAMLDASQAALKHSTKDRPDLYFLGFAGYSLQNVFRNEVSQTRELFDQRFGTSGRSMLLINHRDTYEELPLASASNLALALEGLGRRMDRDKDILFLFLTSHGSEGVLDVSFPPFALNDLTAPELRAILDSSGIKNRVIVISACHSGSFVPALENANTLVMTAASAERSSFGCDDERDWTYFGEALFDKAMRETSSFVQAFDLAKATISAWEREQQLTPSEPQLSIGAEIRATLAGWERQLAAASLHGAH